jgi:CHAT domain-containing protein
LGRLTSGEGVTSLGQVFQYSRAQSVTVSLWKLEEKSSILLTEKFFQHLKRGKNNLTVLKDACNDLRRMGIEHSFSWVPTVIIWGIA